MLHLTPLLLALQAPAPVQDAPVELVWAPGTAAVQHQWVTGHQLYLDSFVRQMGDQRQTPPLRWAIRSERTLRAVDEVRRAENGRPLELRRTYQLGRLAGRMDPLDAEGQVSQEVELLSALNGTSVVWTWIPSEGDYGRYFDALEGQESDLAEVREDLDLRSLLPEGPVTVGQEWTVDPMQLRDVLEPGGRLSLESETGNRLLKRNLGSGMGHSLYHLFGGSSTGKVTMRLRAVAGDEATITMDLTGVRFLADISDYVRTNELHREAGFDMKMTGGQLIISFEGTGSLVWNLAARRASSFELTADETMEMTLRSKVQDNEITERIRMVGLYRAAYSAGPPGAAKEEDGGPK